MSDPYVYSGTDILMNIPNIRDRKMPDNAEAGFAAIWKVHGFREGNTRLAITFCCQFMEAQGIPINRTIFEKHSTYVHTALVAYCAVFHDLGNLSKKEYLEAVIRDTLENAVAL